MTSHISQFLPKVSINPLVASPYEAAKTAVLNTDGRIPETMRTHLSAANLVVAAAVDVFERVLSLAEVIKVNFSEDGAGPMLRCEVVIIHPGTGEKETVSATCRVAGIGSPLFKPEEIAESVRKDLKKSLSGIRSRWTQAQTELGVTVASAAALMDA